MGLLATRLRANAIAVTTTLRRWVLKRHFIFYRLRNTQAFMFNSDLAEQQRGLICDRDLGMEHMQLKQAGRYGAR